MAQLIGVLGTLLIFGAIVAIHEFGHFIVAKLSGMGVYEYSLGFGPALFKKEYHNTLYALRIIPLGGYVRIAGMEMGEDDAPNGYDKKPFFAKFATLIAGVVMNFVLALVVFIVMGITLGFSVPNDKPIIGGIMPKSPAAQAQLRDGDRIVSVDGTPVKTWEQSTKLIRGHKGSMVLVMERAGVSRTVKITPKELTDYEVHGLRLHPVKIHAIGISPSVTLQKTSPVDSIVIGGQNVLEKTQIVVASLVSIVMHDVPVGGIGGPLQVMSISYSASKDALVSPEKLAYVLSLFAFLSINIGFFNLLPIPALDGGRLLFLIIEGIRGKAMNKEKEAQIHAIGMAVLLLLILLVTIKDVFSLFGGK